jgi:hypothetical protein
MKKLDPRIKDLPENNITYHYEYSNIQNQRIALVKLIHLWHQIGFPAAYATFGFFLNFGYSKDKWPFLIIGAMVSSLIILLVRTYAVSIDKSVIKLYPRILALELILNYYFYRNYLRSKGKAAKKYIEKCEEMTAQNADELQCKINCEFRAEYFPHDLRGHELLNKASVIIVVSFWAITLFSILWLLY